MVIKHAEWRGAPPQAARRQGPKNKQDGTDGGSSVVGFRACCGQNLAKVGTPPKTRKA